MMWFGIILAVVWWFVDPLVLYLLVDAQQYAWAAAYAILVVKGVGKQS